VGEKAKDSQGKEAGTVVLGFLFSDRTNQKGTGRKAKSDQPRRVKKGVMARSGAKPRFNKCIRL